VQEASAAERQDVYSWLFKTRHRGAQDLRIQTLLEIEAFGELHRQWKKLGYPFEHLVPSYATAIGSSGDRPAALAELMGIIVNDGMRLPMVRIDELHFAAGTPYETVFQRASEPGERVMEPEVAATLRRALREVVDAGTARRVHGAFDLPDGTKVEVGGKTGTGDNRIEAYGPKGRLVGSRAVNRTATFVFYIGDRYFGTLTAFVTGAEADKYSFTSALPAQILKALAPQLAGFLDPHRLARCSPSAKSILAQVPRQTEGSPR
jgi:membrane peptidoglycan carboxypeptidase